MDPRTELASARPEAVKQHGGKGVGWGILACLLITGAAWQLSELPFSPFTIVRNGKPQHPIEPVMMAIILGMIIANLIPLPKALQKGIKFSAKRFLPLGVIFLGARLDFNQIIRVGSAGLLMSLATIIMGLGLFLLFIRLGWVRQKLGLLLGIGTAICGGTAIVAAAPVIEADEQDVTFGVATVTLCGLVAMFVLPVLAGIMHLSPRAYGMWAGLSIHQTPQVIAAGFALGEESGAYATTVKLSRVCLLAPVLMLIGWQAARMQLIEGGPGTKRIHWARMFPMFVLGFIAMALLRTLGLLPEWSTHFQHWPAFIAKDGTYHISIAGLCEDLSKFFIVISMAGVGLETRFSAFKQTGLKPLVMSFAAAIVICVVILICLLAAHV